jgi:hypothetical protein
MSAAASKKNSANRPLTHWLAHWSPTSVIAVDADGQEHPIVVTKQKRKWDIAAKAVLEVDAVTVRAMSGEGLLATRTLRTIDSPATEEETQATPATPGGYDVTAVVQCVAREVREAVSESTKQLREMLGDVVRSQAAMLKDMSERHSASEKALLDAREQIMIEREERIAEREEAAAKAEAESDKAEQREQTELVKSVIGMAMQNPDVVSKIAGAFNGKASPKVITQAAPPAPPVKPNA